ncbi:hypothetical protein GJ631_08895 [Natronomonas sp. CBA1123]|uniref:hypothetical protein n=1 Tax=Natronomonas sp. CBA1123 TaxID=2668070 RepID=UPI0012EA502A|nr:hypothetical protein [Natronomonas sp. CBA1123]MUV86680.1 hypothetical protein [Natronomonas sp. CBA1123]
MTDETPRRRSDRTNPVGIAIGSTLGPFSAAVGSVVSEDRFAFKLSVGAGRDDDDGFDDADATTIKIEDADEETVESSEDDTESSNDEPAEADD